LDWAHRINSGETGENIPAPKANGASARHESPKEKALMTQLLETQVHPAAPVEETDESEDTEQASQPAGALPPGVEGPVKPKGKTKRDRPWQPGDPGRPPRGEKERLAAEEAAAINPALVPQQPAAITGNGAAMPPGMGTAARPPGVSTAPAQVQPQMPAMPAQEEYSNGAVDLEALRLRFAEAIGVNPQATNAIMRANTWPNGESKPVWYAISNVVPMHFDALYGELGSLLPAGG
jgi:hypothetical protein